MGHEKASVLDGGLPLWLENGLPTVTSPPPTPLNTTHDTSDVERHKIESSSSPKLVRYKTPSLQSDLVVEFADMLYHATDFMYSNAVTIIDCRPAQR